MNSVCSSAHLTSDICAPSRPLSLSPRVSLNMQPLGRRSQRSYSSRTQECKMVWLANQRSFPERCPSTACLLHNNPVVGFVEYGCHGVFIPPSAIQGIGCQHFFANVPVHFFLYKYVRHRNFRPMLANLTLYRCSVFQAPENHLHGTGAMLRAKDV